MFSGRILHALRGGDVSVGRDLRIATAFFTPGGFSKISSFIESASKVRLLLGAEVSAVTYTEKPSPGADRDKVEGKRLKDGLNVMDRALRRDRDHMPLPSDADLRKLISVLRSGNMEVRRYESRFLHAKAYISTPGNAAHSDSVHTNGCIVAGSSNLTSSGMSGNLELNLGRYDKPTIDKALNWFDTLWDTAVPYDLAALYEDSFQPREPWEIFIRVLWQFYKDDVAEEVDTGGKLSLARFQKHGVERAMRLIEKTGGAIVADEVGLGKTFIAGEIWMRYRESRRWALVICPASLRDSTWKKFAEKIDRHIECVSFEELAGDRQFKSDPQPNDNDRKLKRPLDEYQLVIIDEAHNYRNPYAPTRYTVLRKLLRPSAKRHVLMLTATPVNNSLWDLYHLMALFVHQDTMFVDRGIPSMYGLFKDAMHEDPSSLNPDILYPVIDATTVKRTRHFVKKHYIGDVIPGEGGTSVTIKFPKPKLHTVRYKIDEQLPGFFDRLESALEPDGKESIVFARYMPDEYQLHPSSIGDNTQAKSKEAEPEKMVGNERNRAMVALLRTSILKRFESSVEAFRLTVQKMADEHDRFLEALDSGHVVNTKFMKELSGDDETAMEEALSRSEHIVCAKSYDVDLLREVVRRDRDLLRGLADDSDTKPEYDLKLKALSDELVKIVDKAKKECVSEYDEQQKRKVLVFSFFEHTVHWIHEFLKDEFENRNELSCYKTRMSAVSGSDVGGVSRQNAILGFAPISMESEFGAEDDCYDILVTTDVLAEGVNLQQCRHIINFDMPWNPMRLVQRHGRIDRINSPYSHVFMRTFFPVDRLDAMLNLERRILDKLSWAAASIGVEAPIEGAPHNSRDFPGTADEIKRIYDEDASILESGKMAGAALTGEEYRQSLRQEISKNKERIVNMPWKVGSGMVKGSRRGMFFCALVDDRIFLRFVPADSNWDIAVSEVVDGDHGDGSRPDKPAVVAVVGEVGTCLRMIECEPDTPKWFPDHLRERLYDFWEVAQKDVLNEWSHQTDPKNFHPSIGAINRKVIHFINKNPPKDVDEETRTRALDMVDSPWRRPEENLLREWFASREHEGAGLSSFLIERIIETGHEPMKFPEPLNPISIDDIKLLCWMGIEPDIQPPT